MKNEPATAAGREPHTLLGEPIPPPPREPSAHARTLLFGLDARDRLARRMRAILGAIGALMCAAAVAVAIFERSALVLVYLALAAPFLYVAVWGARKHRKLLRDRREAFVHGVPIRARITMRSFDPPQVFWAFSVDGAQYTGWFGTDRAADLPVGPDDTHLWVLRHPRKPRRNTLYIA